MMREFKKFEILSFLQEQVDDEDEIPQDGAPELKDKPEEEPETEPKISAEPETVGSKETPDVLKKPTAEKTPFYATSGKRGIAVPEKVKNLETGKITTVRTDATKQRAQKRYKQSTRTVGKTEQPIYKAVMKVFNKSETEAKSFQHRMRYFYHHHQKDDIRTQESIQAILGRVANKWNGQKLSAKKTLQLFGIWDAFFDENELKFLVSKLREEKRKKPQNPKVIENLQSKIDGINFSRRLNNQKLMQQLEAREVIKATVALYFEDSPMSGKPDFFILNPYLKEGEDFVAIPIHTCKDVINFKEKNKEQLDNLSRNLTMYDAYLVHCKGGLQPEKTIRGGRLDVRGGRGFKTVSERLVEKGLAVFKDSPRTKGPTPSPQEFLNAFMDLVYKRKKTISYLVKNLKFRNINGEDVTIFDKDEKVTERDENEIRGRIRGTFTQNPRERKEREIILRTLNEILRSRFGDVPRESQSIKDIIAKTPKAKDFIRTFNSLSIPPISLSQRYMNRNDDLEISNDYIEVEGLSFNSYPSVEEFIKKVYQRLKGRYYDKGLETWDNTYYLARQFNNIYGEDGLNWDPATGSIKNYKGKTSFYNLDVQGLKEPNLDVTMQTKWKITGERVPEENKYVWTFKLELFFGQKQPEEYEISGGLEKVYFEYLEKEGKKPYFTDDITKRVEVPLDSSITFNEGNTIMNNDSVVDGLNDVIDKMIDELKLISAENMSLLANIYPEEGELSENYDIVGKIINEIKKMNIKNFL